MINETVYLPLGASLIHLYKATVTRETKKFWVASINRDGGVESEYYINKDTLRLRGDRWIKAILDTEESREDYKKQQETAFVKKIKGIVCDNIWKTDLTIPQARMLKDLFDNNPK